MLRATITRTRPKPPKWNRSRPTSCARSAFPIPTFRFPNDARPAVKDETPELESLVPSPASVPAPGCAEYPPKLVDSPLLTDEELAVSREHALRHWDRKSD